MDGMNVQEGRGGSSVVKLDVHAYRTRQFYSYPEPQICVNITIWAGRRTGNPVIYTQFRTVAQPICFNFPCHAGATIKERVVYLLR
jgi:hypothetical protein